MREGGYERFRNFIEFIDRFQTEEECRDYLYHRRWPDGFTCTRCGGRKFSYISTRGLYQCSSCDYQASLTAGTIMEKTRTPLRAWFFMIFLMANQKIGVSILGTARLIGISYKSAWLTAHKIRSAMADRDFRYKLEGFIEMDESYFGAKKPGKRGRGAAGKRPVLVGVNIDEHGPRYAFMKVIENVDADTVKVTAKQNILSDSHVKTDGFRSYHAGLSGYNHEKTIVKDPKAASKKLPWVHILVANAKNMIRGVHHGVSPKHLQPYLSEFCWRFSRRRFSGELFDRLLYTCITGTNLYWHHLVSSS